MDILISGASGLVGSELVTFLTQKGHYIKKITLSATRTPGVMISMDA